jgi:hypothetical protein
MLLYNVPRHTWVVIKETGQKVKLGNIDGMYSYCKDEEGEVCHPVAWTEVDILEEDSYGAPKY